MDHLVEMLFMGDLMFKTFSQYRKFPFTFENVIIVVYFHDMEKIFREQSEEIDKSVWYTSELPNMGITFSEPELNALEFIHGEPDNLHNPDSRIMNELASFCHAIDNMSARLWYNYGRSSGELGVLGIK